MQCSLILQLFLIPDGEIASSVVLIHSKSLEGRVWMAPQPVPVNTVPLSKYLRPVEDAVLFSMRLVEGRWRKGPSVE